MSAMPWRLASRTLLNSTARPSMAMVPASGCCAPPRIFISVLLPAPFSPTRASTSPATRERETPASAITPGNRFVIALIASSWAGVWLTSLLQLGEPLLELGHIGLVDHLDARIEDFPGRHLPRGAFRL